MIQNRKILAAVLDGEGASSAQELIPIFHRVNLMIAEKQEGGWMGILYRNEHEAVKRLGRRLDGLVRSACDSDYELSSSAHDVVAESYRHAKRGIKEQKETGPLLDFYQNFINAIESCSIFRIVRELHSMPPEIGGRSATGCLALAATRIQILSGADHPR